VPPLILAGKGTSYEIAQKENKFRRERRKWIEGGNEQLEKFMSELMNEALALHL
jgi:hypothetical protein